MNKITNLKDFLGQFIKNKPNMDKQRLREAYKKRIEEQIKKFNEKKHGKHDKFDDDDFIY